MTKMVTLYETYGQSVWLDYLDRRLLEGGLQALIAEGLRGVTTNPTVFHKAMSADRHYDEEIVAALRDAPSIDDPGLYERLVVRDVQAAADVLEKVHQRSGCGDGFVSLEVSPRLAYETDATIDEARRLWRAVDRPNLMIKVPGTEPGLPAIERLIAEGINVNVTLLFSVDRYRAVAEAYLRGLAANPEPAREASVASFFLSRIDTEVDAALDRVGSPDASALRGKTAIASAALAYQHFREVLTSPAFAAQRARGASPQRPLWASTSTKDPAYSDLLYVEQLIGPHTVTTLTPETLAAFRGHGTLHRSLESRFGEAQRRLAALAALGIDLPRITRTLEREGVRKFEESYEKLLVMLQGKRRAVAGRRTGARP